MFHTKLLNVLRKKVAEILNNYIFPPIHVDFFLLKMKKTVENKKVWKTHKNPA
jgi:hypothetical protein